VAEHYGHPFGIIDVLELGDGLLRQGQAALRFAGPAGSISASTASRMS
jgi:hypothetical protein